MANLSPSRIGIILTCKVEKDNTLVSSSMFKDLSLLLCEDLDKYSNKLSPVFFNSSVEIK